MLAEDIRNPAKQIIGFKNRFLIFAFCYLLSILYLKKPDLQYPFLLESEITGLTALSSFGLSFFLHQVASVSSLPLLFSTQLHESLCVPDGEEHLGNCLLAGSVSPFHFPLLSSWPSLSTSSLSSSLYNSVYNSEWSRLWSIYIRM